MESKQDLTNLGNARQSLPDQYVPRVSIRELSREQQQKWIERLFSRLLAIYGDRFAAMWAQVDKNEMKEVWSSALGGFSAEELKSALEKCYQQEYPPNLPQFVDMCRKSYVSDRPNFYNQLSHKQTYPSREEAVAILARLKEGLVKTNGEQDEIL